jgi:MarC family membrane protein
MEIVSATILLLLVLDPVGNVPSVLAALKNVAPGRWRVVLLRECAIAYTVLLAFMFGGRRFLELLGLTDTALEIAGGVILFLIALKMVFGESDRLFGDTPEGEPLVVPIAIPFTAGPSAMATVLLMASREPQHIVSWVGALTLAMLITSSVLVTARRVSLALGTRGVVAVERLMGLLLSAIAIQMLLTGIERFVGQVR